MIKGFNLRDEKGSIIILVAIMLVVLFGFAAVSVDTAALASEKRKMSVAADAAALAAAKELPNNPNNIAPVKQKALNFLAENYGYSPGDVEVEVDQNKNTVKVSLKKPADTFFASVLDRDLATVDVAASAKAEAVRGMGVPHVYSENDIDFKGTVAFYDFDNGDMDLHSNKSIRVSGELTRFIPGIGSSQVKLHARAVGTINCSTNYEWVTWYAGVNPRDFPFESFEKAKQTLINYDADKKEHIDGNYTIKSGDRVDWSNKVVFIDGDLKLEDAKKSGSTITRTEIKEVIVGGETQTYPLVFINGNLTMGKGAWIYGTVIVFGDINFASVDVQKNDYNYIRGTVAAENLNFRNNTWVKICKYKTELDKVTRVRLIE